jgi:alanine racemase
MKHRCWVEVDGRALDHNYRILRGLIPSSTLLLAVVKANAYGHGLVPTARKLEETGADWFGVANVHEGTVLREAGVRLPVLLLSATLPEEMSEAVRQDLTLTISSLEEARNLQEAAKTSKHPARFHFKIDTGMGRLGYWHEKARDELALVRQMSGINLSGLYTHFASADVDAALTEAQWKYIGPFFAENSDLIRHAANSPVVTRRYGFPADMVRVGLALYGIAPNPLDDDLGFRPALAWKSRIVELRDTPAGRTISYGATYRTPRREIHAVVGMGYGDGYFRAHSQVGHMLVGGRRCPIRGRVTMDQIIVDVTAVTGCRVGDEVVALGRQGSEAITARELAVEAGTIPWEILTNVGARVPREYLHFPAGATA